MVGNSHYVVFACADRTCALRREAVRELLPLPNLWRPPGVSAIMAGFINLGGAAIPVIALARLFGLDAVEDVSLHAHILLLNTSSPGPTIGLLVDRVLDLVAIATDRLLPVDAAASLNGCVEAELEWQGGLAHLLAVDRILLAEERERLAGLTRTVQRRLAEWPMPA